MALQLSGSNIGLTGSFNTTTEGIYSGSFSGSFVGDGSGLTGIPGGGNGEYVPFITGSVSSGILPREGSNYCVLGAHSTIAGGTENTASATCSFIGGGKSNYLNASDGAIVGGCNNCITSAASYGFIGAGDGNTNQSEYGVLVGGDTNCLAETSLVGFIGGGACNNVCADKSSIVGGQDNSIASGASCSNIGGGANNQISATAVSSSIIGGTNNATNFGNTHIIGSDLTADKKNYTFVNNLDVEGTVSASIFSGSFVGDGSGLTGIAGGGNGEYVPFITGSVSSGILPREGENFTTLGANATIAGGRLNTGSAPCSFVGGGRSNKVCTNGQYGSVLGGQNNQVHFCHGVVAGGLNNTAVSCASSIVGGADNCVQSTYSTVVSGQYNEIKQSSINSFIGAGLSNTGSAAYSFIGGGQLNSISGSSNNAVIAGGYKNSICEVGDGIGGTTIFANSFIGAGSGSKMCSSNSFIGGGGSNTISSDYLDFGFHSIVGGQNNSITSNCHSFIGGGCCNRITEFNGYASILGGCSNCIADGEYTSILGGRHNLLGSNAVDSFIVGSRITGSHECTSYVNNLTITGSAANNGIMTLKRFESTPTNLEAGSVFHSGSAGAGCLYFSPNGSSICQIAFV